jgi:cell division transport system permease protein
VKPGATPLFALERERIGTFALLIGVTCLLLMLAAALTLAIHATSLTVKQQAKDRLLVQVAAADRISRDAVTAQVMQRLSQSAGVQSAHRLPEAQAAALVAPYMGEVQGMSLPSPTLIDVRTTAPATVEQAVHDLSNVTTLRAARDLEPVHKLLDAVEAVTVGAVLLAAAATIMIAVLAARTAISRERATLTILHAVGATDGQIARLIGQKLARDAVIGAAAGAIVALVVVWLTLGRVARAGLATSLGPFGWSMLVLLPVLLVACAMAAAQAALFLQLRDVP